MYEPRLLVFLALSHLPKTLQSSSQTRLWYHPPGPGLCSSLSLQGNFKLLQGNFPQAVHGLNRGRIFFNRKSLSRSHWLLSLAIKNNHHDGFITFGKSWQSLFSLMFKKECRSSISLKGFALVQRIESFLDYETQQMDTALPMISGTCNPSSLSLLRIRINGLLRNSEQVYPKTAYTPISHPARIYIHRLNNYQKLLLVVRGYKWLETVGDSSPSKCYHDCYHGLNLCK